MTKMNAGDFKPGDLVRWIGEWAFPLVDAPPRENTVLAIEADGKVFLEGRHGGEAPVQWWCPPDQLVHRVQVAALEVVGGDDDPSLQATGEHHDNNVCSACGATFNWNEGADRDEPDQICNPCAQQIASEHRKALGARTPEETATDQARKARNEGAREYREFLQWLGIGKPKAATSAAPISVGRWEDDEALDELMNQLVGARCKVSDLNAERDATAKRLRDIMSTCFDGSRSGDLAFQLEDMEEWIPKFTSEWKANHRRWLALCDRLGFDALDLSQHGRVAEVDAVAGDAFELRRIRAIVEDDARKRHGDREGEPSWGVIADCVLRHASQHRQAREILGVAENVTLDQGLSELRQVLWAFEASLVSSGEWSTCPSRAMGALIHAVVAQAEQWRARLRDGVDDDRAFVHKLRLVMNMASGTPRDVLSTAEVLVRELKEAREQLAGAMNLIASLRADMTRVEPSAARAEIQAVLTSLSAMKEPPSAGLTLTEAVSWLVQRRDEYKVLFGEGVDETRACRAHLTARHAEIDETREILTPTLVKQVESLSAEVARLTGEVAATRAGRDDAWRHMDRELIEADAALRVQVSKSFEHIHLPHRLPLLLWLLAGYFEAKRQADTQTNLGVGIGEELRVAVTDRLQQAEKALCSRCQATAADRPQVRCTGYVTVRINKDRVVVKGQTWTSDDPNFKAWDVSLHDDDPRFGFGAPQQRSHVGPTMELGERTGTWMWRGSMVGFGDIKWQGAWTAEPTRAASAEIERLDYSCFPPGYTGETTATDAWTEWKLQHDPPGISLFCHGQTWSWQLDSVDEAFEGTYPGAEDARAAAWAWYDRRLTLSRRCWAGPNPWPRCMAWSNIHVASAEHWLTDSTAEMPEVLRG